MYVKAPQVAIYIILFCKSTFVMFFPSFGWLLRFSRFIFFFFFFLNDKSSNSSSRIKKNIEKMLSKKKNNTMHYFTLRHSVCNLFHVHTHTHTHTRLWIHTRRILLLNYVISCIFCQPSVCGGPVVFFSSKPTRRTQLGKQNLVFAVIWLFFAGSFITKTYLRCKEKSSIVFK